MDKESQLLRAKALLASDAAQGGWEPADMDEDMTHLADACSAARQSVQAAAALLLAPCDPPVYSGSSGQVAAGTAQDMAGDSSSSSGRLMYTWQAVLRHILMVQCLQVQVGHGYTCLL
jgi:hypothetical protein